MFVAKGQARKDGVQRSPVRMRGSLDRLSDASGSIDGAIMKRNSQRYASENTREM